MDDVQVSALRLFHALIVPSKRAATAKALRALHEQTIPLGFVLTPLAASAVDAERMDEIASMIGISGQKANASFHKSWKVVEESTDLALRLQQIIHYITTYGFEAAGIYDERAVYIPPETLQIPTLKDGLRLVVIDGLSESEVLHRALRLASGIALKPETADDAFRVLTEIVEQSPRTLIARVGNLELRSKLYDHFGLVPDEPREFLRFLVQKLTGETLLIKNAELLTKIAESDTAHRAELPRLLRQSPANLASIFLRYKPIFLAIRKVSPDRSFFNRLRKKAVTQHKPMPDDVLNGITARLKRGTSLRGISTALKHASIFRKIRLAYALQYRTVADDSIVYRVRNGTGWASEFAFENRDGARKALRTVLGSICDDLGHLSGKTIYIPPHVGYTLPATEKAFTGHFPHGSYIAVPEDMIVGIHWFDVDGHRIDLDLSTVSANGKIGWDADYRSAGRDVLFSGDMTFAPKPNGASELFYIKRGSADPKIMFVNYFNYDSSIPVEAKIVVAQERLGNGQFRAHTVDPNNVLTVAPLTVTRRQTVLGLLMDVDGQQRFYFAQVNIGNNITSDEKEYIAHARQFYAASMVNAIGLSDVLVLAGAKVVASKPARGKFIDLSPELLTRTTVLDLLKAVKRNDVRLG